MERKTAINNKLEPLLGRKITALTGRSMYPTLTGEYELALVDTRYKGGVGIRVGDVVQIWHPHRSDQVLGKRVKGLEGHTYTKNLRGMGVERVVVPKGYCNVVGDNENISEDSREFGSVPLANILGKIKWRLGQEGFRKIRNNNVQQRKGLRRLLSLSDAVIKQAKRLALGILPASRTQSLLVKTSGNASVINSNQPTSLMPVKTNKVPVISSARSRGPGPKVARKANTVSTPQSGALVPKAPRKASVVSSAKSKANT